MTPVPTGTVLTRREMEVALLAADGLASKQIAQKLRLSKRTIDSHLYRAMQKTGTFSRVQLARHVHGLAPGSIPQRQEDDLPSSFTQPVFDGEPVSFTQFAMRCARNIDFIGTFMHEEPLHAPVPDEFTPRPGYAAQLSAAEGRLAEAEARTDADWDAYAAACHADKARLTQQVNAVAAARRERLEALLAEVDAWEPPSRDHEPLKEYMRGQLGAGLRECGPLDEARPRTGAQAKAITLGYLRDEAYSARAALEAERRRAADSTRWLQALRASLGEAVADDSAAATAMQPRGEAT